MENIHYRFPHGLLLLFFLSTALAMIKPNFTTDQYALFALRDHITTDPHQILAKNWSIGSSVCEWIGVTCGSRHRRVIALNVSNMGFSGFIPPQLGNLSFLRSLDMSRNTFHGELPHDLARLPRLRVLNLGLNNLSGDFPTWFGSFHELQYLSLIYNNFTGLIPPSISNMSKLTTIYLSYNALSGNIPTEFFNISSLEIISFEVNSLSGRVLDNVCPHLRRLKWISLSRNKFSGEIPSSIAECSQLQKLSLSNNNFSGFIPKEMGSLKVLEILYLDANRFKGVIPKEIGNASMLKLLDFGYNNITGNVWLSTYKIENDNCKIQKLLELHLCSKFLAGVIPLEISNLSNLETLGLQGNSLTGSIPIGIFNLSTLRLLSLAENQLSGILPSTMGYGLPNLERLYLVSNNFSGPIPNTISNSSKLNLIEFGINSFTSSVPRSLGDLRFLEYLDLCENNLVGDSPSPELSFITSLTNCGFLRKLAMCENPLNGILPNTVGNLSTSLERLYAYNCKIKGSIPDGFGNLSSLVILNLDRNQLTGSVPTDVKDLQKLQGISLGQNKLSQVTLDYFCVLHNLGYLSLEGNLISGSIPECLGNLTSLRYLYLGSNKFSSTLPTNFWSLEDILEINITLNSLSGSLPPKIMNLKVATYLDLSMNHFSGGIPSTFGDMQNLQKLSLAHNRLQGSIPESFGKMLSLEALDLSHNHLSGMVPMSMENLRYLTYLNVSFNNLSGEIPSSGPFQNFTSKSFLYNEALCGAHRFHVPPCPSISAHNSRTKKIHRTIFVMLGVMIIVGTVTLGFVYLRYRRKNNVSGKVDLSLTATPESIPHYKLLQATNGFSESNLLGTGSFGLVYKGTLDDGRDMAIKVFNLQLEGAFKSFDVECEILRSLHHRNLTKVVTSCSNGEFKALVLEFMPHGSLEKWLHSPNYFLDIMQRLDIMIDVACAVKYLHCDYPTPVVHCDLKPSNILLDESMVAHVSDFGIAKLLGKEDSCTFTKTLATLGYLAPEYGSEGLISTKCDVYSFGIMMMEVFTRINPNDEKFGENLSLKSWVNDSMPNRLAQIIDANLLRDSDEYFLEKLDCISSIMTVALNCTRESPRERINIQDVLVILKKIKLQLLPYIVGLQGV